MKTKKGGAVMEQRYETRTNGYDTMCHDDECAISNLVLGELAKRGGAEARTLMLARNGEGRNASVMKSYMRY
jgi:hypothetical protein